MSKNILIIGGNSGIGKALIEKLSSENHNLFVASRNPDPNPSHGIHTQSIDVTAEGEISLNDLPEKLDGLVYCPGSINLKPFNRLSQQDFQNDLNINFFGLVKVLHHTIPNLRKSGNASVVAFSTVAVNTGMPFHASVASAKAAVEGLMRSLASEYAPVVRFNIIAPSLTDTPLAEGLLGSERKREAAEDRHPLKKVGHPGQLAATAAFLLSEEGSWISGQTFHIDGGMSNLK
ncbi:MAG: SDR family oxidoreductase [Cryomorphaceae bacterium]|nr:SDR family oxidoreductase [Cryomorphaceae bacterium]